MLQPKERTESWTRCLRRVLLTREAQSTERGGSVCFLSSYISPYQSLRVSSAVPFDVVELDLFFGLRCVIARIEWRNKSMPVPFLFDLSNLVFLICSPSKNWHRSLSDFSSGELAKVWRWIHGAHYCRRMDGIDTPGSRCPWYLCPQTISNIIFGRFLSRCSSGISQPKYHLVRLISQIHAGKREGKPGLCFSGISPVCGLDFYVAAPRAVQKRRRNSSHGLFRWRGQRRPVLDCCIMQ